MADVVLSAVLQVLLEKLASQSLKKLTLLFGIKKDLRRLANALSAIKAVLEDAERRQVKENALRDWLGKLKDAAYDADDILDDLATESKRQEVEIRNRTMNKVCNFFSHSNPLAFNFKMVLRIKDIMERLNDIAREKSSFHLREGGEGSGHREYTVRKQTHSFVDQSEVCGRGDDCERIVHMLIGMDSESDISVTCMVGIAGLGKTTLAQFVYNDGRVTGHFDLRIWVYVSQVFDVEKIVKSIIEQATAQKCDFSDMEMLQNRLRRELREKRYLLVLDDVWIDNHTEWERLKTLLRCGMVGSKIMVTTRKERVASIMGPHSAHHLQGLSEDDCWTLFKQRAFQPGEEKDYQKLVDIGREIIRKCSGVPLAAKALGGLLHNKRDLHDWLSIKESECLKIKNEKEILPALRLSYFDLPSHLRQCFAYCSIFPKGYRFSKDELILQWMAEGFLQCGESEVMEDKGADYFDELCCRSFFQVVRVQKTNNETVMQFTMHDLISDLARSVASTECSIMDIAMEGGVEEKTRYLSLVCEGLPISTASFNKAQKLRTLISLGNGFLPPNLFNTTVNCKCLRVLDLSYTLIPSLPDSIGKLKHLRYLGLSGTLIRRLPSTICSLWNLQTLSLEQCPDLQELPEEIRKMISLRHLKLTEETYNTWTSMPSGIGQLRDLQKLPIFIVGRENGCRIEELQGLRFLRGGLEIRSLENVVNPMNARKANLEGKQKLQSVTLSWGGMSVEDDLIRNEEQVIENLQPHSNLEVLRIVNFKGVKFPHWMLDSRLPLLVRISFEYCTRCETLPSLKQLRFLRFIKLHHVINLEEWLDADRGELPSVEELIVDGCPKLNSLPCLPSLRRLEITQVKEKILKSVANSTLLSVLHISKFREIISLPKGMLQNHSHLNYFHIAHCPKLKSLSEELNCLAALENLDIRNCGVASAYLGEGCHNLNSLKNVWVEECDSVSWPEQGSIQLSAFTSLKFLCIDQCKNLRSLHEGLQCLTSLESLIVLRSPEFTCLPESLKHLTSLHLLRLYELPKLESLPNGMGNLTSLRHLDIGECPGVTCLPAGLQHLTSLHYLEIWSCPELERRCQKERGEDWHKIQHIPKIIINGVDS